MLLSELKGRVEPSLDTKKGHRRQQCGQRPSRAAALAFPSSGVGGLEEPQV
jgi:hypothetical protein